jgi:hypothetical protein
VTMVVSVKINDEVIVAAGNASKVYGGMSGDTASGPLKNVYNDANKASSFASQSGSRASVYG